MKDKKDMKDKRVIGLLLIICQLVSCQQDSSSTSATAAAQLPAPADGWPASSFEGSRAYVSDSVDVCYRLIQQASAKAFIASQKLPFKVRTDTVSNDERGLLLGPKLTLGHSYIQWDNENRVTRLFVDDKRIRLNHGIRIGMAQKELLRQFGMRKFDKKLPDTLSVDCQFLDNGCDFIFRKGQLASVSLVNEAD